MTDPARILVIANKSWEAAPLVQVLLEKRARPDGVVPVARPLDPGAQPVDRDSPSPRLVVQCREDPKEEPTFGAVQVWAIEDWMDPRAGTSNTAEKWRVLPRVFERAAALFGALPEVVVAFGTAGLPTAMPFNGCVTIGSRAFVHDPFAERPPEERVLRRKDGTTEPMWTHDQLDKVQRSAVASSFFQAVPDWVRHAAEARFVRPPVHPADPVVMLAGHGFASIGTVNVVDYDDYAWADRSSMDGFRRAAGESQVGSIETTHGLIRLAAEAALGKRPAFLFVSGILNSLGYFEMEVAPRVYAQNFVAAHNAGVATAWLLPALARAAVAARPPPAVPIP